jgi:hypothetical protein
VTTVSVPSSPVVVFTPSGADTTATLTNTGLTTLYLGQSAVTAATGFPLGAGKSMQVCYNAKLYAVAAVDAIKTPTSTASAQIAQGATAITVASGGASFTNGMVISIIDGNNTELVVVGAGSTGTSVVVAATANAHASGVTFGQFNGHQGGSIQVAM